VTSRLSIQASAQRKNVLLYKRNLFNAKRFVLQTFHIGYEPSITTSNILLIMSDRYIPTFQNIAHK
jgi:hypothetical protein